MLLEPLAETQILGSETKEWIVPCLACASLENNGILSAGISFTRPGYQFVRLKPGMSVILACASGKGQVWIDNAWYACKANAAYITPPDVPHAYYTEASWELAWVAFTAGRARDLSVQLSMPALTQIDPGPLYKTVEHLYQEYTGANHSGIMHHLSELLVLYCQRILEPWSVADGFQKLWSKVDSMLAYPWTLDELAHLANMSSEHLRKQCHQRLGRSPGKHLAYLRMQRSTHFLKTTNWTIEDIGYAVGYQDAFAFSTAFKRWIGLSPSAYREQV